MKPRLNNVRNTQGRADVLLYRLVERLMGRIEATEGLTGLREHVLPLIEEAIADRMPAQNVIPRELRALMGIRRTRC